MNNFVELVCEVCGATFSRLTKEHTRSIKLGRKEYCSPSCSGKAVADNLGEHKGNGRIENLVANNRLDKFSPFRYYINKAYAKDRIKAYGASNLTLEYLKEIWEAQKGICPYTRKQMELPLTTKTAHIKCTPIRASLDRIDPNNGYVKGNVEFVCLAVNLAKSSFSKEQLLEFFNGEKAL